MYVYEKKREKKSKLTIRNRFREIIVRRFFATWFTAFPNGMNIEGISRVIDWNYFIQRTSVPSDCDLFRIKCAAVRPNVAKYLPRVIKPDETGSRYFILTILCVSIHRGCIQWRKSTDHRLKLWGFPVCDDQTDFIKALDVLKWSFSERKAVYKSVWLS